MTPQFGRYYWVIVTLRFHGREITRRTIGSYHQMFDVNGKEHFFWEIVGSDHMIESSKVTILSLIEEPV